MSNRDMCISVINSMEEWQLQSVLEMLNAVKGTMDKLETGALETARLRGRTMSGDGTGPDGGGGGVRGVNGGKIEKGKGGIAGAGRRYNAYFQPCYC